MTRPLLHHRNEGGTAIVEFIWLGLILLVPLVYVVITVFTTQRTSFAASAAARSATRAFITAPDEASGYQRARTAARLAFAEQDADDVAMNLRISCSHGPGRCLAPGSVVTASIASRVRLPLVPAIFGSGTPSIAVNAEHREPYGEFREAR